MCRRNLLVGTALSVVPAGVYYLAVFPFDERQISILIVLGLIDIAFVVPIDLLLLRRDLSPVQPVFSAASNSGTMQTALVKLIDLPRRTAVRVFGPHALIASIGITLLILAANRWLSLAAPLRDFPMYWLISLSLVPIAHAVYEFTAMERAVQRVIVSVDDAAVEAFFQSPAADNVRFGLNRRLRLFFGLLSFAPMLLLLIAVFNKTRLLPLNAAVSLIAIPVASSALVLFLIVRLSRSVDSQTRELLAALDRIVLGEWKLPSRVFSNSELGRVSAHINRMSASLAEKEKLRDLFGAYMTPALAETLLRDDDPGRTERRFVTLMFIDVRGFTSFSAAHPAEFVLSHLNRYLAVMVESITEHRGTVNKYLGDGLLAIFGAPIPSENSCADAVAAAFDISRRISSLRAQMEQEGRSPLAIGMGIHCGEVLVGSIGSPGYKMEYTAIGDAVNLASRIEQLTKALHCEALVSSEVAARLAPEQARYLGPECREQVKGLDDAVRVRSLLAAGPATGMHMPPRASRAHQAE